MLVKVHAAAIQGISATLVTIEVNALRGIKFYLVGLPDNAVKESQQPEGYWTRSMLDMKHAPGAETSGTAFFTYALLWGINNGYLKDRHYWPTVELAWNYLTTKALQEDGSVGYVQPIGERAIPGQVVNRYSTANFGVGAFLLAACEMVRYIDR